MANEAVKEFGQFVTEWHPNRIWKSVDLRKTVRQPVSDSHVFAPEFPHQFHIMVAGDTKRHSRRDHILNQADGVKDARATIHEVADEYRFSSHRMGVHRATCENRRTGDNRFDLISQLA